MSLWSKVRGTIETIFQLGLGGPQLKNNSGAIEARDAADATFVIGRGATPVAANDWATKAYVDSGSVIADGGVQTVEWTLGTTASQPAATSIPNGALIFERWLIVTTPYSVGTTVTLGNAGSPAQLQATTDNNPQAVGTYEVREQVTWTGPAVPLATIAGSPVAGAAKVMIRYVQAAQP